MSLAVARDLASLVTQAGDDFIQDAERELERYHALTAAILVTATGSDVGARLDGPTGNLGLTLGTLWAMHLNALLAATYARTGLLPPVPFTVGDAVTLMQPGAAALRSAALMTFRTNRATTERLQAAWDRQYEVGGAFTALRGTIRGATAGTFNTLANASVIDALPRDGPDDWILGAYNPLDERTAELDARLCLNSGTPILTARGRVVTSIPGLTGKYDLRNAWVPGSPRQGGDTHTGCRCWLVPERREA